MLYPDDVPANLEPSSPSSNGAHLTPRLCASSSSDAATSGDDAPVSSASRCTGAASCWPCLCRPLDSEQTAAGCCSLRRCAICVLLSGLMTRSGCCAFVRLFQPHRRQHCGAVAACRAWRIAVVFKQSCGMAATAVWVQKGL